MYQKRIVLFLVVVCASGAALAQNVLVNGNFELNPPTTFGNNIGYSIAPWTLIGTAQSNVVKVDGPLGFNYGTNGPESDASAPGMGIAQHYLDIASGSNTFYQTFTPRCSGLVRFGGAFSTRANLSGSGFVEIRQGNSPSGTLVGSTQPISLPVGNSQFDPWTNVSFSVPITAFQTYTFVVNMDNNLNFDNGFVEYNDVCPAPDPCCPPWNESALAEMMVYQGTGGIAAPYTLKFQPSAALNAQMQTYINYLNSVNSAITQITIQFRLHDGGTGATPVTGAQLGVSHYITWQAGLTTGPFPAPTFFSGVAETMLVGQWYVIHTGIYLENGQQFFGASCADNDIGVRIQVVPLGISPGAVMSMRDRSGRTVEKALRAIW
jgi:hypothetical protein